MKKTITLLCALHFSMLAAFSFAVPAGTYYFDNSKTQFSIVKFVYGSDTEDYANIISLTEQADDVWQLEILVTELDMYRYTYAETSLTDGVQQGNFNVTKDYISLDLEEMRTAASSATMLEDGYYVPATGTNWAQGEWEATLDDNGTTDPQADACTEASGTLPVFYLNTDSGDDITSKEDYVAGSLYIDATSNPALASYGTDVQPSVTRVRGRGNWTWSGFEKKPYKIKMDTSAVLLGMGKSKTYCLLAHSDDNAAFLRNPLGFELSRMLGLNYTPAYETVELMLNGVYQGIYFLTEQIRISKHRLKITEQDDGETDPYLLTGGWLVEIDNYEEENNIDIVEYLEYDRRGNVSGEETFWLTYKEPDSLSSQQEAYLQTLFQETNDAIYTLDKSSTLWEDYIDIDTLVNFYIVQEIMGNGESFHGSCYMHKERGNDTKIEFGPVWDFGNSFSTSTDEFLYIDPLFGANWIAEIALYPRFQEKVKIRWNEIYDELPTLYDFIDDFVDKIDGATACDYSVWSNSSMYDSPTNDPDGAADRARDYLEDRIAWLHTQWELTGINENQEEVELSIYPNPTHGTLHLNSSNPIEVVTLMSLCGEELINYAQGDFTQLSLTAEAGTYLLRIKTVNGSVVYKKLVIL